jgi:hypothetical protein
MEVTAAVNIIPHDVASRVDPIRLRQNRSRYIDGRKFTLAQQKTMSVAAAFKKPPATGDGWCFSSAISAQPSHSIGASRPERRFLQPESLLDTYEIE